MSNGVAFPESLEACHALIAQQNSLVEQVHETNESLAHDIERLKLENEELKRYIYGRRSERYVEDDSQLKLFDDAGDSDETTDADLPDEEEEVTYRRKKRRTKTERFPDNARREIHTMDVPEAERMCSCCGEEMPVIETDVRERLDYIPAQFVVHELHYPKRACSKCKNGVTVAPPPTPDQPGAAVTPGSRYGFGVTIQTILGKFADHLPLYRMEDIFARSGVVIPRSTQVGLLDAAADLLEPLYVRIRDRLLASSILGMDDTPVRLQDASLPGKMRTARFWLCRGRDDIPNAAPYNCFFFHESRERDGPAKFLNQIENGYHGWVVVDAYGVDDGVYLGSSQHCGERVLASCCHAHARRKFEAAKSNDPRRASHVLAIYRRLYDIEDRARELSPDQRWELRQTESRPILEEFKTWLDEQANGNVLPKSAIGGAIRYALNQWTPLMAFLQDGGLPMDNNDTERDLRRITIGRKNWMFLGSSPAGDVAAKMYTIIASASRHQLDLWAYMDDVLRRLCAGEQDIDSLLPDVWRAAHPNAVRTYRQHAKETRRARQKQKRARRQQLTSKR